MSETDKVKIAVVGVGAIAQVTHLPIWRKLENVEVVAVCDTNRNKARWVAEKYGVPSSYSDLDTLLQRDDIEAVDICTPTHSHVDIATSALSSGKHVLVEKPIARNYAEAHRMTDYAKEYGRSLMVGMNVRFRQDAMVLKTFTQQGELGHIFYAKTGWLRRRESMVQRTWLSNKEISGGGVFMDLGIQMLDVGLWLMGESKAVSVVASTYNNSSLSVEDSAAVFVRMENGATLTIEVSWTLLMDKDFFYTNLFGESGGALLNPLRVHKELHNNLVNVTPAKEDSPQNIYKKSYENELRAFVQHIRDQSVMIATSEEILERMRIVDAVYESAKTGREVLLQKRS